MNKEEWEKSFAGYHKDAPKYLKQANKKLQEYHDKNPYAASHPYSKGPKLKPVGAPPTHKPSYKHKESGSKWHPIGAGKVGDKYRGGIIKKIDHKNAKALVAQKMSRKNISEVSPKEAVKNFNKGGIKMKVYRMD